MKNYELLEDEVILFRGIAVLLDGWKDKGNEKDYDTELLLTNHNLVLICEKTIDSATTIKSYVYPVSALKVYDDSVQFKRNKQYIEAYFTNGEVYFKLEDEKSAKELCDKIIKLRDGNSKLVRSIKKTKKTIKETEDALDINITGMVKATASIAGNIVVGRGSTEGAKGVTKLVAKAVDAIKIGKTKVDEVSALIGTGEKQKN